MKDLTKNSKKNKNIVMIITSILSLLLGVSFFFSKDIKFVSSTEIFYIILLLYFGLDFTNYLLTRKESGLNTLYKALVSMIASFAGLKYASSSSNIVLSVVLGGWSFAMLVIKLIRIEELRDKNDYSIFVNLFCMSLFILLCFLTITNLYLNISNKVMILGFFFVVNGIINIVEVLGNIMIKNDKR